MISKAVLNKQFNKKKLKLPEFNLHVISRFLGDAWNELFPIHIISKSFSDATFSKGSFPSKCSKITISQIIIAS